MPISHPNKKRWYPAPCQNARRLLIIAISTTLFVVLAVGADLFLRVPHQGFTASQWMKELKLSAPALWTAGTPMRHPETIHPGVDLRFSPGLEISP